MIDQKELAEALKGCRISFLRTGEASAKGEVFEVTEVTPPPKKPEVRERWAPLWWQFDHPYIGLWRDDRNYVHPTDNAQPPRAYLRREIIDGIPQQPILVSAKEQP